MPVLVLEHEDGMCLTPGIFRPLVLPDRQRDLRERESETERLRSEIHETFVLVHFSEMITLPFSLRWSVLLLNDKFS